MKQQTSQTPACERAEDLISFLYGEVSRNEAQEFETHLQQCHGCRSEMASFGMLRESIGEWREEALSGASSQVVIPVKTKSALGALRSFFDLSPLWMKGAVGFAAVVLCMTVVLTLWKSQPAPVSPVAHGETYSKDQVDQLIKQALDDQAASLTAASSKTGQNQEVASVPPKAVSPKRKNNSSLQWANQRRLSKAEREQLAADLRLLSTTEDESLTLLGEKINQEF